MLTHRNKKPYECKAEGCGKSYCDARSLRRHTENHHAGSKINESISPSSPTTGPHTPNTPGSNPSTPSTPGATSTTNGHGHAALKQLLATEPAQTQQQKVSHHQRSSTANSLTKFRVKKRIAFIIFNFFIYARYNASDLTDSNVIIQHVRICNYSYVT